jgi:L-asparaginase/Glu-tRNA(Gln) amidotransferase subunit D
MKNILLVLVGGTICTALTEHGTLSVSSNAGTKLVQGFMASDSPYKEQVNITTSENLGILSENMTVDKWNLILKTYKKAVSEKEYDGVIFAHGTDTLAYSASLFSMLLADTKIPVFFASSNARLDTSTANGNENFRCAVECICRDLAPNVYVLYKNISDGRMYLHLGSRLEQCKNYSEDFFSNGAIDITESSAEATSKTSHTLSPFKSPATIILYSLTFSPFS